MSTKKKNVKPHYEKKNPKSAEGYQAEREKQNAARPKQIWDGAKWVRITVD